MTRPWAGYIRVSFVGARGGDSFHSPDDQAREIQRWAADKGVSVVMLPADLDGKSNDWNRPILNNALEGVKAGEYTGIVVAKQDRLAREVPLMHDLLSRARDAGGHLAFADGDVDTTTPDGMMWFNIKASIDQRVRDQHAVDFDRQRQAATERGIWQRRQTPKGYDRDPVTRKLVPNADAALVVRAYEAKASGVPLVQIADTLHMTSSGARHLLRTRVYLGELRVGNHVNPAAHPAVVPVALFDQAAGTRTVRPARQGPLPALLSGLVRCCGCGHLMTRAQTKREVYTCHVRHSAGRCPKPTAITTRSLNAHVEAIALGYLRELQARPVSDGAALERAREAVTVAQADLAAFLTAVQDAGISPADYASAARQRRERLDDARREADALSARDGVSFDGDASTVWELLDVSERAHVLRGLIDAVLVTAAGRGKLVPVGERVRVLAAGSGLVLPVRDRDGIIPLLALTLPGRDSPGVLGVASVEDAL